MRSAAIIVGRDPERLLEGSVKLGSAGEPGDLSDPLHAEGRGRQRLLGTLEAELFDVFLERHAFALPEVLREVVLGETGDASDFRAGERLAEVIANVRQGATKAAIVPGFGGAHERTLDVGHPPPAPLAQAAHGL